MHYKLQSSRFYWRDFDVLHAASLIEEHTIDRLL